MSLDSNIPADTHPHDELAVYALDALEDHERYAVEQHLAACPSCRAELDRHHETLAELTTPEKPPAHVWDRIAEQVADTPRRTRPAAPAPEWAPGPDLGSAEVHQFPPPVTPGPAGMDPDLPRHRAPRHGGGARRPGRWLAGLAAAAALVVVVGVGAVALRGSESTQTVSDLALAAADDPDSQVVELLGDDGEAQARVVLAEDGAGYVLLDDLPTLAAGRGYQLWKFDDPTSPVSIGVLGNGAAAAAAVALPADTTTFALTDELSTGAPAPTGPPVATGTA